MAADPGTITDFKMDSAHYSYTPKRDSDNAEIVCLLGVYLAVLKPVNILSYYRELPISSVSALKQLDTGKFEITLSEMHMQVVFNQHQAILCLDDCTVLAACSNENVHKSTAVISGFRYINLHADQRKTFRLNICNDIHLLVNMRRNEGGRIPGRLIDISISGCKIMIPTGDGLQIGSGAVLEIQIFDQTNNRDLCRSIPARIVHLYRSDDTNFCCLEFIGTPSDQDLLARYLNQQQAALVREFKQHRVLPE